MSHGIPRRHVPHRPHRLIRKAACGEAAISKSRTKSGKRLMIRVVDPLLTSAARARNSPWLRLPGRAQHQKESTEPPGSCGHLFPMSRASRKSLPPQVDRIERVSPSPGLVPRGRVGTGHLEEGTQSYSAKCRAMPAPSCRWIRPPRAAARRRTKTRQASPGIRVVSWRTIRCRHRASERHDGVRCAGPGAVSTPPMTPALSSRILPTWAPVAGRGTRPGRGAWPPSARGARDGRIARCTPAPRAHQGAPRQAQGSAVHAVPLPLR